MEFTIEAIPNARVVYVRSVGPHGLQAVQAAWTEAFSTLQKAGYGLKDKPTVERYSGVLLQRELCELCVPVLLPEETA